MGASISANRGPNSPAITAAASVDAARERETPAGWFLARHIHLCLTEDCPVILNLREDRYQAFSPSQARVLQRHVGGWPEAHFRGAQGASKRSPSEASQRKLLDNLVATGVLTCDPREGKSARPIRISRPRRQLVEEELGSRPSIEPGDLIRFTRAMLSARWLQHCLRFPEILAKVEQRKRLRSARHSPEDTSRAQKAVAAFHYLRPLLFSGRDRCILDSLGLIQYLSYYDLFPDWVIGIQTRPFLAHCWVQSDSAVWNEIPDYADQFTPVAVF